jgi:hypothetical protein
MRYVTRHGRRIAVETLEPRASLKKKRKPFKARWVKFPLRWVEALRQSKSVATHRLAHTILLEAFKREQVGGEIILSSAVTGMARNTKMKAVKELVELGLIEIEQDGKQASKVIYLLS